MTARRTQPLPRKHVPQRTCIACRKVQGKRSLIRLVRVEQEGVTSVEVDATGKRGGRGCYLHPNQACWQNALRSGKIEQALRTRLNAANRAALGEFAAGLPATEELPAGDGSAAGEEEAEVAADAGSDGEGQSAAS